MSVVKKGNKYCVIHGHPRKLNSKTDKPQGSIIKCFPFKQGSKASETSARKKALKMHTAIILSQQRRKR